MPLYQYYSLNGYVTRRGRTWAVQFVFSDVFDQEREKLSNVRSIWRANSRAIASIWRPARDREREKRETHHRLAAILFPDLSSCAPLHSVLCEERLTPSLYKTFTHQSAMKQRITAACPSLRQPTIFLTTQNITTSANPYTSQHIHCTKYIRKLLWNLHMFQHRGAIMRGPFSTKEMYTKNTNLVITEVLLLFITVRIMHTNICVDRI